MYINDNYDLWEQHNAELERSLDRRPVCIECEEHIQDEYCYQINGEIICEDCLKAYYRKDTDSLIV